MPHSTIRPDTTIARAERAVHGDLPGETVLLDTETGSALRLNPSAAWLWDRLEEPSRVADLADGLAERFGIDSARALGDTLALVSELATRGLLLDIGE